MSGPKATVELSNRAQQDYAKILAYSELHWGREQSLAYEAATEAVLGRLAHFPQSAETAHDLGPNLRRICCREHFLYYSFEHDLVTILRILHVRQSAVDAEFDQ